jgi:adenylate cyclase
MTTTRRLAAILAADVAGYSAMMERDEEGTAAAVRALRRDVIEPKLIEHRGRLIKTTGDGFLAEFASPIAALNCALAIQQRPNDSDGLQLRIGLNLGDVIIEESGDVLGEGVNIAARLESLAEPGGILISSKIHTEVDGKVQATFEDRGEQQVKNITRPVRVYAVSLTGSPAKSASASLPLPGRPLPLPDKPSIAVLPFQNMSGDPEQEYFADGMVEDIITALSRFKSLFVIARNSSFTFKGKAVDIKQVGRELGVRYVLEGSVRKAGGSVRITGQLIDTASGGHIWADKFDGAVHDAFDLQDRVAMGVVAAVAPRLFDASIAELKRKPPENWDSYDHVLRGSALVVQFSESSIAEAEAEFRKAIELDPSFGLAYARAAQCTFVRRNIMRLPVSEAEVAKMLDYCKRAADLGSDDEMALMLAVAPLLALTNNIGQSAIMVERALVLNSNFSMAWLAKGWVSVFRGDPVADALDAFSRAIKLNPLYSYDLRFAWFGCSSACLFSGRYNESADWANRILGQWPDDVAGLVLLMASAYFGDKHAEAQAIAARIRSCYPSLPASRLRATTRWSTIAAQQAMIDKVVNQIGLPE